MAVTNLLRQVLAERELSKRGLARMIAAHKGQAGDRAELEKYERAVYRWTSEDGASGMSDENAEMVALVLNMPPDSFKSDAYVRGLEEENRQLTADREERLDRLEADVQELRERLASEQP